MPFEKWINFLTASTNTDANGNNNMNSPPADYMSPASDNESDSGSVMGVDDSVNAHAQEMERTASTASVGASSSQNQATGGGGSGPKRRLPGGGSFQGGSSRDVKTRRRDREDGNRGKVTSQPSQRDQQQQQPLMWDREGKRGGGGNGGGGIVDKEEFVDHQVVEWLRKGKGIHSISFALKNLFF